MGRAHRINMHRRRSQYPGRPLAGYAFFRRALKCQGFGYPARVLVFIGRAADRISRAALREGTRIADYLTGLDKRPGGRGATGGGFVAGAAGRAVSSRRKTTRAVITRTIIDGTTDMRESPDWIVLSRQVGDGFEGHFSGLCRSHCSLVASSPVRQQSGHHRAKDIGPNISSKLR